MIKTKNTLTIIRLLLLTLSLHLLSLHLLTLSLHLTSYTSITSGNAKYHGAMGVNEVVKNYVWHNYIGISEIHQKNQFYVTVAFLFGRNHLQKFVRSVMTLIFKNDFYEFAYG